MTDREKEFLKKIELKKQAGCKMLECGIIKKNIELNQKIIELKKIEEAHRELNGELRKELQLKDRMIDEMIDEYAFSDGINIRNFCDEQLRKDKCIENCEKCIKEYFIKKASEENGQGRT